MTIEPGNDRIAGSTPALLTGQRRNIQTIGRAVKPLKKKLQVVQALHHFTTNLPQLCRKFNRKPVEVTDMTRSRGSWEGEGSWGRRREKLQSKVLRSFRT